MKVIDSGEGIQEDIAKNIADGDLIKLKEFGTGLVMAYSIVKLHKGTFQIRKNYPSGTSITIKIPCNPEIKED